MLNKPPLKTYLSITFLSVFGALSFGSTYAQCTINKQTATYTGPLSGCSFVSGILIINKLVKQN
jgi:hypothetical protein